MVHCNGIFIYRESHAILSFVNNELANSVNPDERLSSGLSLFAKESI